MSADNEFSIIEKRDEAQILSEIQGAVIEEYFYESKGKKVISYTGVKEITREYGNNSSKLVDLKETETAWIAVYEATDHERNITRTGISQQTKLEKVYKYENRQRVKDESGNDVYIFQPDEFSLQKASSKAQRNALNAILPVTIITKALETWEAQKKGGSTKRQPPRQESADVNIVDFMKPVMVKLPDVALIDELNKEDQEYENQWHRATELTADYLVEARLNPEDFNIDVDPVKIAVSPRKAIPEDMQSSIEGIMQHGGFLPTLVKKVKGWRLNKKDVTG